MPLQQAQFLFAFHHMLQIVMLLLPYANILALLLIFSSIFDNILAIIIDHFQTKNPYRLSRYGLGVFIGL